MSSEERDDLDRLYERIEWENPREQFTPRVMARVRATQRAQRISAAFTVAALALLAACGFALGRGLTFAGTLDYLGLIVNNLDLVGGAADDFIAGLGDVVPWLELLAVGFGLSCVWAASVVLPHWLAGRHSHLRPDV